MSNVSPSNGSAKSVVVSVSSVSEVIRALLALCCNDAVFSLITQKTSSVHVNVTILGDTYDQYGICYHSKASELYHCQYTCSGGV